MTNTNNNEEQLPMPNSNANYSPNYAHIDISNSYAYNHTQPKSNTAKHPKIDRQISSNLADNPQLSNANSMASMTVESKSFEAKTSMLYKSIYASMMHSMEIEDPSLYALMDKTDLDSDNPTK